MALSPRFKALDFSAAIDADLERYMLDVYAQAVANFKLQGHNDTGRYLSTLSVDRLGPQHYVLMGQDYAQKVDQGQSAAEVRAMLANPIERMEAIRGISEWARRKLNVSRDKSVGVAIAILKTASKTGFPTPNSKRFSRNGKRTEYLQDAIRQTPEPDRYPSFEREFINQIG